MSRTLLLLAALVAASFMAVASAQVDERARALLEGLHPPAGETLRNLDQAVTTTTYLGGGETMVSTARIVIDFVGRRISMTSVVEGMTTRLVLKDGKVTMTAAGMPSQAMPPEAVGQLGQMFAQGEELTFEAGDSASYDGEVDFGPLASGEQVTYTTHDAAGAETVTHYLFRDGKIVAVNMSVPGTGEMLVVYDTPADTTALMGFDSTTYVQAAGAWSKVSNAHVEAIAYNVTLDESLFD